MECDFLEKDRCTAEYRFARDLVAAVIELRAVYVPSFTIYQLDKTFFTVAQRIKIKELFSKEWPRLDEYIKRYTNIDGQLNYSDKQFLLCVIQLMEAYKPDLKSEEEFLLVCCRITYVAACFLRYNAKSDALSLAVDRVYEILIYTFYSSTINEAKPLIKDVCDKRYRFAYYLVKTLMEIRGVSVPDLDLPDSNNFLLFTMNHKNKIKKLFANEWTTLDKLMKYFTCNGDKYDFSDDNISRCIDKIVMDYESEKNTEEEFVLVCARVAYIAAWCMRESYSSNATELAIDRIHRMVKRTVHFNKYKQDDDYRFACDLVKTIVDTRSDIFAKENANSNNSFFMIAHRNKIEEFLSREKRSLDEVVNKYGRWQNEDENLYCYDEQFMESMDQITRNYNDEQFMESMDQITGDYNDEYRSKEEVVNVCAKVAYVAACFVGNNDNSKAPELAVDFMSEIFKIASYLPKSKGEDVLIMHMQDDHYRFAYDLVKAVLELKNIRVSDSNLPDPDNFLFTTAHRNVIKNLFSTKWSQFDENMENIKNEQKALDWSDNQFLRSIHELKSENECYIKTDEMLLYTSAKIAYLSSFFLKHNMKSNAAFLAVNSIYEMIKRTNCFSNSAEELAFILNEQDENYRFAYDIVKTVFEIQGIPVSSIDLSDQHDGLFTDSDRKKIRDLVSKEWSQLNAMMVKLTSEAGYLDYSDNKFLHCMDQILQDYQKSDKNSKEEYVDVCVRIAYTAANFLTMNYRSNASFLAINRMYEISKNSFNETRRMEEASVEEEKYNLAYDLVNAALQIDNNSSKVENNSSKVEMSDTGDSPFTADDRNEVLNYLSKVWPCLNQLIRKFSKKCAGMVFSDKHFLQLMHRIIIDHESGVKTENELLLFCSRIAYVASYFLKENEKSNAVDLAVDLIYQRRKKFNRSRNIKDNDFNADRYRFAYNIVKTALELQNTTVPHTELPDSNKSLLTPRHIKKIKKLFRRESSKIDVYLIAIVKKLTNTDGDLNYSDENFLLCMDQIFKDYKYEQTTKMGFVRLCARIAYPTSYFVRKNDKSNAIALAVSRIYEMVKDVIYFNKDLEGKRLMDSARNDKYRFAYDLVTATLKMRGPCLPDVKLPDPANFLFTAEHKHKMEELFSKEGLQLFDLMKKFTFKKGNWACSDKSYMECVDQIIKLYKPERYSEEGFVFLCARIAYVAACYFEKRFSTNAMILAVDKIHEMVEDIYSRGTLSQSCW